MTTNFEPLHDYIKELMQRLRVPGVAVGMIHAGEEHTAGFGVTNVEHPLAVDGDTLFQIGSTTKTFTGTAVMRLVEMGRRGEATPPLQLDAPIKTYLPDLCLQDKEAEAKVTMRHLLTHTSGWVGDYFEDFGPGDDAIAQYVRAMEKLPQLTPVGEVWSYNNANFWVAGRVIEVLTGKTWEAAMKELVLDPLGLKRSFFFADEVITHRFAVGHHVRPNRTTVARRWSFPRRRPSGSIISSAKEQLRYARFHMNGVLRLHSAQDAASRPAQDASVPVLSPESIALMQTPMVARDLAGFNMGLTWMIREIDGVRIVQHGGSTNGQMSAFLFVPSRGFALTVLTNADKGAILHRHLTRWALNHFLGLMEPKLRPSAMPAEKLQEYVGQYAVPQTELNVAVPDIAISIREGRLYLEFAPRGGYPTKDSPQPPPPPTRVAFVGTDRVVALDDEAEDMIGEFLRDAQGRVAYVRWSGRVRGRAEG